MEVRLRTRLVSKARENTLWIVVPPVREGREFHGKIDIAEGASFCGEYGARNHFAARGGDLVYLVSLVFLVCVVRRMRKTRQTRAPNRPPLNPSLLTQGSHIVSGVMDTSTTLQ